MVEKTDSQNPRIAIAQTQAQQEHPTPFSMRLALEAVIAILPLSIAVIPWGILTGALAIAAGFTPIQAQCLSLFVFAGAAQLSGITMVSAGVPMVSIFGSTLIISARHLLYSMVFRSHLQQSTILSRICVAFVLTDEMFVVSEAHTKRTGHFSLNFALLSGVVFYLVWNLATYVGILYGQNASNLSEMGLDFAIVATFIAMSFDQLKAKPEVIAVVVSGIAAVVLKPTFSESYIVIATILGMSAAYLISTHSETIDTEAEQGGDPSNTILNKPEGEQ